MSSTIERLTKELETIAGASQVLRDPEALAPYGHDESNLPDALPEVVVRPGTACEVAACLRTAIQLGVPVTPSAARTGKSGGSLPIRGGLVLSVERLNRILEIRKADLVGIAEAGVSTGAYQNAAEAQGLFYPPDPGSLDVCTLGGNVAENAGGPRALKYGVTRDYLLGLQLALPSGQLMRVGKRTLKGVAGFDLVGLVTGSEGMLAIVTEVTTKLLPLPRAVETALALFPNDVTAGEAVSALLAEGFLPRALELLDSAALAASRAANSPFRFPPEAGAAVILEVDGTDAGACKVEVERLGAACLQAGALDVIVPQNESGRRALWDTRRQVSVSLKKLHRRKLSEDIVVPRSRLAEAISRVRAIGEAHGVATACYGHAGDGNFHANVLFDGPGDQPRVDAALADLMRLAIELGGTITGEHGIGLSKKEFLKLEQSAEVIELQKKLKAVFDPSGLLNPGKMFPGA